MHDLTADSPDCIFIGRPLKGPQLSRSPRVKDVEKDGGAVPGVSRLLRAAGDSRRLLSQCEQNPFSIDGILGFLAAPSSALRKVYFPLLLPI